MGISTHFYTVWGIYLEWGDDVEQFVENDDIYSCSAPWVLVDGMGGDYIILGKRLFDSGDQRYGECEDSFVEIDINSLPALEQEYKEAFVKKYPDFAHFMNEPFKLMTLSHYS